ncbi:MAG TPA: arginine deiminase family protein [Thermomicrobiaceae bacterium]|nr:arginine deiminase family protein [Thermomicrobiaceae bacterium]
MPDESTTRVDHVEWGGNSMYGTLRRALVFPPIPPRSPEDQVAFGYVHPIDHERALREHAALRDILTDQGVRLVVGEIENPALQDAIFPYDPVFMTDAGAVLCRMGKPLREPEVDQAAHVIEELDIKVAGRIESPGTLEGGDCLWIDSKTLAIGIGYRTNSEGVRQMAEILGPGGVNVIGFDLPHWHGPAECLHLLSMISMLDADLAVVYLPLMATRLVQLLRARDIRLVEVPDDEFPTQGTNVLALGPRRCLLLEENQQTAARLRDAGCEVLTYQGLEISHNRAGGPTCLTRPLLRDAVA